MECYNLNGGKLLTTGGTDYSRTKQLCLMFSGLWTVGSLGAWCPRLQCLSLKANHLKCLRPLAPLASQLSHLDISDNSISTLVSLSMLTSLRSLAASNNELTSFHGESSNRYRFSASHRILRLLRYFRTLSYAVAPADSCVCQCRPVWYEAPASIHRFTQQRVHC